MTTAAPSDEGQLVVTRDGPVTTQRLNRPARLNALAAGTHHLLQPALDDFAADDSQRIAVLTGKGRAFCAGSDLKDIAERAKTGAGKLAMPRCGYTGLIQRFDPDKPLIAAVNGPAVGGGFEIALACDIVVATLSAQFGVPDQQAGVVAIGGGPQRLMLALGPKLAIELLLTGRLVDAAEGKKLGFVNEVVADDALDAAVARWTRAILRRAPLALRATKAIAKASLTAPGLAAAIGNQEGLPALRRWRAPGEKSEGARAFAGKPRLDWVIE